MITIYHYAHFNHIWSILKKDGLRKSNSFPGEEAFFGLLEPCPASWVKNATYPLTWEALGKYLYRDGIPVLLEVKINAEDQAFVAERAHREGSRSAGNLFSSDEEDEKYRRSAVPIEGYIKRQQDEGFRYLLPEVFVLNNVPPERVSVSGQQPFIEACLKSSSLEGNQLTRYMEDAHVSDAFSVWRGQYEVKYGPIELPRGSREFFR